MVGWADLSIRIYEINLLVLNFFHQDTLNLNRTLIFLLIRYNLHRNKISYRKAQENLGLFAAH